VEEVGFIGKDRWDGVAQVLSVGLSEDVAVHRQLPALSKTFSHGSAYHQVVTEMVQVVLVLRDNLHKGSLGEEFLESLVLKLGHALELREDEVEALVVHVLQRVLLEGFVKEGAVVILNAFVLGHDEGRLNGPGFEQVWMVADLPQLH
jgi:hypothetical protein